MNRISHFNQILEETFNKFLKKPVELQLMWHLESIQKAIDTLKC